MCYMEVNRRGCLWLEVISCLSPMPACCPRPKGNKRLALLQPTHGTPEVLDPRTRKSRNVNIFSIFSYQIYSLLWFCLQCKHRGWDLVTVYPKAAQGKLPETLGFCIHVLLSSLLVTQNQAAPWAGQSCQDIEWTSGSSFHSGGPQTQGQVNLICGKASVLPLETQWQDSLVTIFHSKAGLGKGLKEKNLVISFGCWKMKLILFVPGARCSSPNNLLHGLHCSWVEVRETGLSWDSGVRGTFVLTLLLSCFSRVRLCATP